VGQTIVSVHLSAARLPPRRNRLPDREFCPSTWRDPPVTACCTQPLPRASPNGVGFFGRMLKTKGELASFGLFFFSTPSKQTDNLTLQRRHRTGTGRLHGVSPVGAPVGFVFLAADVENKGRIGFIRSFSIFSSRHHSALISSRRVLREAALCTPVVYLSLHPVIPRAGQTGLPVPTRTALSLRTAPA
jgi:hypothetical protein